MPLCPTGRRGFKPRLRSSSSNRAYGVHLQTAPTGFICVRSIIIIHDFALKCKLKRAFFEKPGFFKVSSKIFEFCRSILLPHLAPG